MYDAHALLDQIDDHTLGFVILLAIAGCGGVVWLTEGWQAARRDGVYAFPPICAVFWLAHDSSFVARFDTWFHAYHHWYPKLLWVGLLAFCISDCLFLWQTARYGRRELAPNLSQRTFTALLVVAAAACIVAWAALQQIIGQGAPLGDDLYAAVFGLTEAVYPPLAITMMVRRGNSAGQTVLMWASGCASSIGYFGATILYFGDPFRSWQWITLSIVSTVGFAIGIWIVWADRRTGLLGISPRAAPAERVRAPA
jgi:hypothetical protein